jgi:hypothetical protein
LTEHKEGIDQGNQEEKLKQRGQRTKQEKRERREEL